MPSHCPHADVEQNDIHMPRTTVREALQISGLLRLHNTSRDTIQLFVDEVMTLVELEPLRNSIVGVSGQFGLSVEQRKRLTIAVELVANPSIVFMDEPTSGLDARAAAIVMRAVRNTVNTGRTVVCTIHQPSIDIFDVSLAMRRSGELCGSAAGALHVRLPVLCMSNPPHTHNARLPWTRRPLTSSFCLSVEAARSSMAPLAAVHQSW